MTRSRIRARFEAWLPLSVTGRGMEAADIRDRGPFGLKLYLSVRTVVLHYLIRKLNVAGVAASVPLSLTGATSDAVDWLMLAPLFGLFSTTISRLVRLPAPVSRSNIERVDETDA